MATVVLDTVDPADEGFQAYLRSKEIEMRVLQEHGPGGGNPEVEYTGSRQALEGMIDDHWAGGDEDFLKTLIK